jgi:hypothetical protein
MRPKLLIFFTFFLNFALLKSQNNEDFIRKVQAYKDSVNIVSSNLMFSDYLRPETFNIKIYMDMFSGLKIKKKNYVFDYYYFDNFIDGKPYLFIKRKKFNLLKHLNKNADKRNLIGKERTEFIQRRLHCFLEDPLYRAKKNVYPKDTEEGYLQYLYFYELGELFALKWHANYKKKKVICSNNEIEEIIKQCIVQQRYTDTLQNTDEKFLLNEIYDCDLETLQNFLLKDSLIFLQNNKDDFIVKWIELEDWGGLFEKTYSIQRTKPYHIELMNERRIMKIQKNYIF